MEEEFSAFKLKKCRKRKKKERGYNKAGLWKIWKK